MLTYDNISPEDKEGLELENHNRGISGMSIQELDDYVAARTNVRDRDTSHNNLGGEGLYWQ